MSAKATEKYPVVVVSNNKITTTSKNIADVFGKKHKDVLEAIRALDLPVEFNGRNFAPVEYRDAKGEKRPMIEMTRDGFTILVMGFTGPKAMKFKLAYIEAFNKMEQELSAQVPASRLDTEILKMLLATTQAVEALHGKMGTLSTVADSLAHLNDMARAMTTSVQQLSQLTQIEETVRHHIDVFKHSYDKRSELDYQRHTADSLTQLRLSSDMKQVKDFLSDIDKRLEEEEQARGGIMRYLETYLPSYELDVRTTTNITPDNDPEKFLKESCTLDPFASVEFVFLYKIYKAWCLSRFSQALGKVTFWDHLSPRLPATVTQEVRKSQKVLVGIKPASDKLTNGS